LPFYASQQQSSSSAAVQPIAQLTIAILIGTIVALVTSMTRLGGFMTFVCSMGSFVGFLMLSGFRLVSILASAGGIGLFLVIVGFYFSLSMWARSRRSKERGGFNRARSH
jgi:hypothetical protein